MNIDQSAATPLADGGGLNPQSQPAPNLVAKAWADSDGTIADAVDILFGYATRDQAFIREALPDIVKSWCQDRIGSYVGNIRLSAWKGRDVDATQAGERARTMVYSLLDFPLPGGVRLGDASADQVREAAAYYRDHAADAAHKARWLEAVANAVGRANCVANKLSADALLKLQETTSAQ